MDSSVISVKLDAFDGPLDLLLHLRAKLLSSCEVI